MSEWKSTPSASGPNAEFVVFTADSLRIATNWYGCPPNGSSLSGHISLFF